jgi:hypothetical protein
MAINTSKVIVGGLIGGVVANVIAAVINGFVLSGMQKADLDRLNPALAAGAMAGNKIAIFLILAFVWMIANVWIYAAIRPRFGPGPKTAAYAGIVSWVIGMAIAGNFATLGILSWSVYCASAVSALINSVVSTMVGAKFYSEDAVA